MKELNEIRVYIYISAKSVDLRDTFMGEFIRSLSLSINTKEGLQLCSQLRFPYKFLVQITTKYAGKCGIFLVLVSIGMGDTGLWCTTWYSLVPALPDIVNNEMHFPPIELMESFYNHDYTTTFFQDKVDYVEATPVNAKEIQNQIMDIGKNSFSLPAAGGVITTAVGLGLMIAICISQGYVPDCPSPEVLTSSA